MPRIVDGDNLLGRWPGRKRSQRERHRLAHEVARLSRRLRSRIVVVFDGEPPPGIRPARDVHYAGRGTEADAVILDRLRGQPRPREWLVVTDDRSLRDQARHHGARSESCRSFRMRLLAPQGDDKPQRENDVEYWLEAFGAAEDDASEG